MFLKLRTYLDRFSDPAVGLRDAVARSEVGRVKRLLARGASPNDDTLKTPLLHQALMNGDAETARLLIAAGATQNPIVIEDSSIVGYLSVSCLSKGRFVHHAIQFDCELARKLGED